MTAWSADELARIGPADELDVASRRPDGSLRPFITIWVVSSADDLHVGSARGPDNRWFPPRNSPSWAAQARSTR